MKLLKKDLKHGEIKCEITSLDDLWFLSQIIDEEDTITGKTMRKLKLGEGTDRNVKIVKKLLTLKILVEKVDFHKYANSLRISGKILEGPEDVAKGSYHSFDLDEGKVFRLQKKEWLSYQLEKLKEACAEKRPDILIVTLDREEVAYALLKKTGFRILGENKGEVSKKEYETSEGKNFYAQIVKQIQDYQERFKPSHIILASPAFWKEDLLKLLKTKDKELAKSITLATCNTVGKTGVEEVLKRDEVKTVLKLDRTAKEEALVEELFKEISTKGKASYGKVEVETAADAHAIAKLLVTDDYIHQSRDNGSYKKLDTIMKSVDKADGKIHIITTENDAGKKLDGLGGIAAILRYKLH